MMTNVTESDRFPWWRFFGPWPLQPLPVAAIIGLMSVAIGLVPGRWLEQWPNVLTGVVVFLVTWMLLSAASRMTPGLVAQPLGYAAVLILSAVVVTMVRAVADVLPGSSDLSQRVAAAIITSTLFLILVQGILGTSSARLRREVSRANEAVEQLREQQTALLRADESVRQQVAVVLHDQVQAGLVSACIKLQRVRENGATGDAERRLVSDVVTQLEQLRSLDLRRAVRSLSPNLRDIDMHTALEELAEIWAPTMPVKIDIRGVFPRSREIRLGAYRIIEQGLLNAAGHGSASECRVTVEVGHGEGRNAGGEEEVTVTVDDNGSGLSQSYTPGLGSTLISTWCATLRGNWGYADSDLGGVRLIARFPVNG
jgi:glucose-6-phosphate-specific signal transduction histidine kinase